MNKFEIVWVADEDNPRDYKYRQYYANEKGVDIYIEQHLNAKEYDQPGYEDNPAMALVASNASATSRKFAKSYARHVSQQFKFPNQGVVVVDHDERGNWNLYYTKMPAVLLEPLYVSDAQQAELAADPFVQQRLAHILFETVLEFFPSGARIGVSCGHLFKESSPFDTGAPVKNAPHLSEGSLSLAILRCFEELVMGARKESEPGQDEIDNPVYTPWEVSSASPTQILLTRKRM